MQLPSYRYKTNKSFLDYEFNSIGPRGRIKKVVRFTLVSNDVFNLAFGDLDEYSGEINDISVTNNDDSKKVLSTVASIVFEFTNHYPDKWVLAIGSTQSRNRLYRMGIANQYQQITSFFEVYGLKDGEWELFKLQKHYNAFLVRRK